MKNQTKKQTKIGIYIFIALNVFMYMIVSFLIWNINWYKQIPVNEDYRVSVMLFELIIIVVIIYVFEVGFFPVKQQVTGKQKITPFYDDKE